MKRQVRWTQRALSRLEDIAAYIAKENPERAKAFVVMLRDKVEVLQGHELGTPGRKPGTRELVLHKNYIAVYRVAADGVQILTLLHAAQNR